MPSCAAIGCTNRFKSGENIQFFGFPLKDQTILQKWLHVLRRKDFKPTKWSKLCSKHFIEDDYLVRPGAYIRRLKPSTVPSVFDGFPTYYKPKKRPERSLRLKKINELTESSCPAINEEQASKDIENMECEPNVVNREQQTDVAVAPISQVFELKHKIKVLQQRLRRRNRKLCNLKDLLETLKKKGLLNHENVMDISNQFQGLSKEIFNNEKKNYAKQPKGRRYSNEIKRFALTLHFHSPKAYNYCRSIFKLPHPSALTNWTSSVNAEPGFLKEVFTALKDFPVEDRDCALLLDGMAIRKQIIWSPKDRKFVGFCDFGNEIYLTDPETPATEVLVFMLVSLNDNNHKLSLIMLICQCYLKIRLHAFAKFYSVNEFAVSKRHLYNKLVLFLNQ